MKNTNDSLISDGHLASNEPSFEKDYSAPNSSNEALQYVDDEESEDVFLEAQSDGFALEFHEEVESRDEEDDDNDDEAFFDAIPEEKDCLKQSSQEPAESLQNSPCSKYAPQLPAQSNRLTLLDFLQTDLESPKSSAASDQETLVNFLQETSLNGSSEDDRIGDGKRQTVLEFLQSSSDSEPANGTDNIKRQTAFEFLQESESDKQVHQHVLNTSDSLVNTMSTSEILSKLESEESAKAPVTRLRRSNPLASFLKSHQPAATTDPSGCSDSDSFLSHAATESFTLRTGVSGDTLARFSRQPSKEFSFNDELTIRSARRCKSVQMKYSAKSRQEFNSFFLIQELNGKQSTTPNTVSSSISSSQNHPTNGSLGSLKSASMTLGDASSRAILTLKFSPDGNFLAAAGAEGIIKIWRLLTQRVLEQVSSFESLPHLATIFEPEPYQVLEGHEAEILDLAWSSNNFLLSASMDKTVRLWHYSRPDCLGIFQHLDYVTSVSFHPRDPRLFLSGSLDCKLRLWSIQDRVIKFWNELPPGNFITAVAFTQSGRSAVAGTSKGIALIFEVEGLRYNTQIHVRSSNKKTGKKITGIQAINTGADDKILVSSNDSRIRMYSLRDKNVVYKYKGHENASSQIRACLSNDGDFVISGSENCYVYIWSADAKYQKRGLFSSFRHDHVDGYECFKAHSSPVTAAIIAPSSVQNLLKSVQLRPLDVMQTENSAEGQIIVTADTTGQIKVFENNSKLKEWLAQ